MPDTGHRFVPPAPYPGSPDQAGLKHLRDRASSQIASLPRAVYEADIWTPPLPGMPVFVMSPDLIQTVLLDQAETFPHGHLFTRIMRPAWGEGLLLAQGDDWKMQRRAAAQAFRAGGMTAFVPHFVRAAEALADDWLQTGGAHDISEAMRRLTFGIIVETMLSGADTLDLPGFRETVQLFFVDISKLRLSYLLRGDAYHAGRPVLHSSHRAAVAGHIANLVNTRRASPPRGDLVDLLLAAQDPETGQGLSDQQLTDDLLGFILAGYETTAAALSWALYLIAADPSCAARIRAEGSTVLHGGLVTPANLEKLVYTRQVVSEALRVYPPAFMITRVAARDTTLGGLRLKAGRRVNVPIWALHRQSRFWPDPHTFNPGRFSPDQPAPQRYTYMPFGAGPRICIGAAFATTEMVTVLATLLRRVEITPPDRKSVWPETGLALNIKGGLTATIKAYREASTRTPLASS